MNRDDNTPALGVPLRLAAAIDDASVDAIRDEIDPDVGIPVKDLNLFDAYWHELARMAAEDPRPNTPEEQADVDALYASVREMMSKSPAQVREERRTRRQGQSR